MNYQYILTTSSLFVWKKKHVFGQQNNPEFELKLYTSNLISNSIEPGLFGP